MEDPRRAQLKAMFSRLAGDDGEVDAEELQDILTTTLTKNMGDSVFALDACRAMISMLDVSYTHIVIIIHHLLFQILAQTQHFLAEFSFILVCFD